MLATPGLYNITFCVQAESNHIMKQNCTSSSVWELGRPQLELGRACILPQTDGPLQVHPGLCVGVG